MSEPNDNDDDAAVVAFALAGTPDRVLNAIAPHLYGKLGSVRDALAHMTSSLPPAIPSPELRDKIEAQLAALGAKPRRRILAVLDMIEDYLTPGRPLFVPRAREIIPAIRTRIEQARRDGEPVLFLVDRHEPNDPDFEQWPLHAVAGTSGGDVIAELSPREGDVVIPHRTYSAFFGSNLEEELRKRQIDEIVLTGCATELGLFATATDALMRGFKIDVPRDSQAGASAMAEEGILAVLGVMRPLAPMPG